MKRLFLLLAFPAMLIFCIDATAQHKVHSGIRTDGPSEIARESSALASATVNFGAWMANPHLCPAVPPNPPAPCPIVDRFAPPTQFPRRSNHHVPAPEVVKIKAGGTVNFIIGGLHVVAIYDNGTTPDDIDDTNLVPNRPPMTPPIINDPINRIYRGLDPLLLPAGTQQDRVESVQFSEPGVYLVICAVLPHFREGMYMYVRVLPGGGVAQAAK